MTRSNPLPRLAAAVLAAWSALAAAAPGVAGGSGFDAVVRRRGGEDATRVLEAGLREEAFRLWRSCGFGADRTERAAWVVRASAGVAWRDWPWDRRYLESRWLGPTPAGAFAIVHTHPAVVDPRPSPTDRATARTAPSDGLYGFPERNLEGRTGRRRVARRGRRVVGRVRSAQTLPRKRLGPPRARLRGKCASLRNRGASVAYHGVMRPNVRTLIVDDEPLARERLRTLLAEEPGVEVVGECGDGCQAVVAIEELKPDLVFLDVQVPNLDGFRILESVGADRIPAIVFVTAYDHYALRAFDVRAVDYILKPFGRERLQKALEHARAQITREKSTDINGQLVALLEEIRPQKSYLKRIMIKSGGRLYFLRTADIDWVEAAGNYVRLHVGAESHLLRETMNGLETKLDPDRFIRIHRSTMVNIERIKELQPWFHGDYVVILRDDRQLTMSASYREKLDELRGRAVPA